MIAKDGEVVPLFDDFEMDGEVENWLNVLTVVHAEHAAPRDEQRHGGGVNWEVDEDMPRHKWLFDYPAQVVLTGTQICLDRGDRVRARGARGRARRTA